MNKEHNEHCDRIAKALRDIVDGKVWKNEDGEEVVIKDGEEPAEDWEEVTMWDYFDDFLDVKYILDSDREYFACRVLVAFGGPNIYINTESGKVELYWWTERGEAYLDDDVIEAIDEVFREFFAM